MIATDEDALICDFAEYYHIYDYKSLGVSQAAILACGLPDFCRIKRQMANQKIDLQTALLALIYDDVNLLLWRQTKSGQKGRNKPKSIYSALTDDRQKDIEIFDTPEEFERRLARIKGEA